MAQEINQTDQRIIAAFDFDGTIIKHNSLPFFMFFAVPLHQLVTGTVKMLPFLLLFKLKMISNEQAKERLIKIFFAGLALDQLNLLSERFIPRIERMLNPLALEKIKWHQQRNHEIVIISASPENWILPWAKKNTIDTVLATKLEVDKNLITGNFLSKNCLGIEKVNRLLERFPERTDYILYAYGDSNGDKELLDLADHSFYRRFS